jgi:hypothetical protein
MLVVGNVRRKMRRNLYSQRDREEDPEGIMG